MEKIITDGKGPLHGKYPIEIMEINANDFTINELIQIIKTKHNIVRKELLEVKTFLTILDNKVKK